MKNTVHAAWRFSKIAIAQQKPRSVYTGEGTHRATAMAASSSAAPNSGKTFAPVVDLNDQVKEYLTIALGEERLSQILVSMCCPPLETCVRINTQRCTTDEALELLKANLEDRHDRDASLQPHVHPVLKNVLCIPGSGRLSPDYSAEGEGLKEVVVTRKAGEAVLRGAPVFAPGVLAMSKHLVQGDTVAVSIAREIPGKRGGYGFGMTRGYVLPVGCDPAAGPGMDRSGFYIGIGVLEMPRKDIFNGVNGVAVSLQQRVFGTPPFPDVMKERGWAALQNLPSTVAATVLDAQPGMNVLDMCASPGGKTCAIADSMCNQGKIVAFDRTGDKSLLVRDMAQQYGHGSIVHACKKDSTTLVKVSEEVRETFIAKMQPTDCGSSPTSGGSREDASEDTQSGSRGRKGRGKHVMSESEINRRVRRAAAAARHGHPEPKHNRIPAGQQGLGDSAGARLQEALPVAEDGPEWLERESFERLLLDAPCSALGLRPRLTVTTPLRELQQAANYQRMLIREAVHVLAVGGVMVYSTCTLNPAENEGNVRWLLDRYPQMELIEQSPRLGGPGIVGKGSVPCSRRGGRREEEWLREDEAALVQRFDTTTGLDSIAFFIAKFRKVASIPEEDGCEIIPTSLGAVSEG